MSWRIDLRFEVLLRDVKVKSNKNPKHVHSDTSSSFLERCQKIARIIEPSNLLQGVLRCCIENYKFNYKRSRYDDSCF